MILYATPRHVTPRPRPDVTWQRGGARLHPRLRFTSITVSSARQLYRLVSPHRISPLPSIHQPRADGKHCWKTNKPAASQACSIATPRSRVASLRPLHYPAPEPSLTFGGAAPRVFEHLIRPRLHTSMRGKLAGSKFTTRRCNHYVCGSSMHESLSMLSRALFF